MTTKRREFLMLAQKFNPKKHGIGGWFMSDKLDGQRAFWDGGISRGMPKHEVPWANNARDKKVFRSTGLWSRLGNVIHAPDWWLNKLPPIMLDGELWHEKLGDGERQDLTTIIKKHQPGPRWKEVKFYVFGLPARHGVFADGRVVAGQHFEKILKDADLWKGLRELDYDPKTSPRFINVVKLMQSLQIANDVVIVHKQERLPFQTSKALEIIEYRLDEYIAAGGEGLILRKPESAWIPKRVHDLLKVKRRDDAEGIVIGYISGRETERGSKLLGLMGALILNYDGKRLELSGFTDEEREFDSSDARQWAEDNPGQEVPDWIASNHFPRGSKVTFRYRGTSKDGIPTEAAYWRKY